jgi:hypothetical protein
MLLQWHPRLPRCLRLHAVPPDALTNGVAVWKYYVRKARAAIAAMREPTDEIKREAGQSQHEAYQAIIDAALKENVEQARSAIP